MLERIGQKVATGAGILINQHDLGAVERTARGVENQSIPVFPATKIASAQYIRYIVGGLATTVSALIDYHPFLINLGKKHAIKEGKATGAGIGEIDIANSATGLRIHILTIVFDPAPLA